MIGLVIQKFGINSLFASTNAFATVVSILFVIYYIVAIVISFWAYREFKGMLYDNGMGGGMGGGLTSIFGGRQQ